MMRKSFWRAFVDGMASIGEGMASIFNLAPSRSELPSYEEQFGTDVEILASDWKKVGDDFRTVLTGLEKETKGTPK
jgi:hypothetical protein